MTSNYGEPLELPDGPGWWAFEGEIDSGEGRARGQQIKTVCKVFEFYGKLTAWITEKGIWGLGIGLPQLN